MLGTFEKARRVLDLYSPERPEWGVSEVARRLGMPTSSAHVLLASLAHLGLLHRTLAGRYRLGFKLLALSQVLLANTPWRDVAQAQMRPLAKRFGETVQLGVLDGGQFVTVASLGGGRADSAPPPGVGAALPAHASPGGRVLLAFRPPDVVEAALRQHADPPRSRRPSRRNSPASARRATRWSWENVTRACAGWERRFATTTGRPSRR